MQTTTIKLNGTHYSTITRGQFRRIKKAMTMLGSNDAYQTIPFMDKMQVHRGLLHDQDYIIAGNMIIRTPREFFQTLVIDLLKQNLKDNKVDPRGKIKPVMQLLDRMGWC